MRKGSAIIDMGRGVFLFKGHEISMDSAGREPPSGSRICGKTDGDSSKFCSSGAVQYGAASVILQLCCRASKDREDIWPRVMRSAGTDPVVCIVNCSDRYRLLRKGKKTAIAFLVEEI